MYPTRKQISRWVYLCAKSHETHSNGASEVGSMVTSTRHHRLEGGDAIPIREEGTSAAIILIAGFLRHSIRPGIGQFALKAIIAKQHISDDFAFSFADPRG